jgi:hypothetical protein
VSSYHSIVIKTALMAPGISQLAGRLDDGIGETLHGRIERSPHLDPLKGLSVKGTFQVTYFLASAWGLVAVCCFIVSVLVLFVCSSVVHNVDPGLAIMCTLVMYCISGTIIYIRVVNATNSIIGEVWRLPARGIRSDPLYRPIHLPGYWKDINPATGIPKRLQRRATPPTSRTVLSFQCTVALLTLVVSVCLIVFK